MVFVFVLTTMCFAATHLIGWNFFFATSVEKWLWRGSSVACGMLPFILVFAPSLKEDGGFWNIADISFWVCIAAYAIVRGYLLAEAFVGLRHMPVGVYRTIQWTQAFPSLA